MSLEPERSIHVFFSYARQDKALRDKLEEHLSNLKYRGLIQTWHNREISAGSDWATQTDIYLDKAHIILLLISSSFMASEYCYSIEMKRALERHEKGEARVIPVLLRPVLYTDAPFAKLKFLPTNYKPVMTWRNRDSAFVDIAMSIERVVSEFSFILRGGIPSGISIAPDRIPPTLDFKAEEDSLHDSLVASIDLPVETPSDLIVKPLRSRGSDWYFDSFRQFLTMYRRVRLSIGIILLVGLLTVGILLAQYWQIILFVGAIVGSFLLLAWIIFAFLALLKRRQKEREIISFYKNVELPQVLVQYYYNEALEAYEKALHRDPIDFIALKGKANALVGLERYREALQVFEVMLSYNPIPDLYLSKGKILSKLGRYFDALIIYEHLIQLDPTNATAYAEMAEVLEQRWRTEEAKQAREKAKELGYEE